MTDGYGKRKEVKELVAAVCRLSGPGNALHGVAQNALEVFCKLDYANQCRAVDALVGHLEIVFGLLTKEIKALVRN